MNHRLAFPPEPSPFFLDTGRGDRFCMSYPASVSRDGVRDAVIYLHPFAEEMNKARRMAALQARSFAQNGVDVLQIDLYGCGDSAGELKDAHWELWKDDVASACRWLRNRGCTSVALWGLRLGAVLALDIASSERERVDGLILWQPVYRGAQFLTQFLRIRLASELAAGDRDSGLLQALRDSLRNGGTVEVGGYELSAALAAAIERLNVEKLIFRGGKVHWLEVVAEAGHSPSPAAARVASAWDAAGVDFDLRCITGLPFWATQEIAECLNLVEATSRLLRRGDYAC